MKKLSRSLSDLSQSEPRNTSQSINTEDSVSLRYARGNNKKERILIENTGKSINRKGRISKVSLFSKKSNTPRPEKTILFFSKILQTLSEIHEKYGQLAILDDGIEDYNEICRKIDDRIKLIQTFKTNYESLLKNKEAEYNRIRFKLLRFSNKSYRQSLEQEATEGTDAYWSICRELSLIECELEKCTGRLRFQIMDLDSISKLNVMDQYELAIQLNERTTFKTNIKIEKNGDQLWDTRHFDIIPNIDDSANIKFSELNLSNNSTILLDNKLSFLNDMIKPSPSIFNCWLTPLGTIKLNTIVQWENLDLAFSKFEPPLIVYNDGTDCLLGDL